MEILARFTIPEITALVNTVKPAVKKMRIPVHVGGKILKVPAARDRLECLQKDDYRCACCGLQGVLATVERYANAPMLHLVFYGYEKEDVLVKITRDHVLPRSLGGLNTISNYQTLCERCNSLKGATKATIEQLQAIRKVYLERQAEVPPPPKPKAAPKVPPPKTPPKGLPQEQIRLLAYFKSLRSPGRCPVQNWLEAEQELVKQPLPSSPRGGAAKRIAVRHSRMVSAEDKGKAGRLYFLQECRVYRHKGKTRVVMNDCLKKGTLQFHFRKGEEIVPMGNVGRKIVFKARDQNNNIRQTSLAQGFFEIA